MEDQSDHMPHCYILNSSFICWFEKFKKWGITAPSLRWASRVNISPQEVSSKPHQRLNVMKEVNRIIKKRVRGAWRITCDLLNTGLQSAGLSGHLSVLHCWHRWGQWDARTLTLTLFTSCTMPWGPMTNGQSDPGERHLKTWRRAPWMVRQCRLFPFSFEFCETVTVRYLFPCLHYETWGFIARSSLTHQWV